MPEGSSRPGELAGYLRCACERGGDGVCRLTRRKHKSPVHIGKPYWDGHSLLLNVMSPTAGLLAGDTVEMEVEVGPDAALTLSSPSALRIHKMDPGLDSTWTQRLRVAAGGFLELNPEWLILQAQSSFTQRAELQVTAGGELLYIEAISPGRVAHGESFAFTRFRSSLSLRYDGALAASERHCLEPERGSHRSWMHQAAERPFYLSILLISESLERAPQFWAFLDALKQSDCLCGYSKLAQGPCWNFKYLGKNPSEARKTVEQIRQQFFSAIGRIPPKLRRQ